jgi:ribosomal protein S24E
MTVEIKIESQKENKLLGRKEITLKLSFTGPTPKREEIKNEICARLGLPTDVVMPRKIKQRFGIKQIEVLAHVYKDAETLKKTEPRYLLVRHRLAEKKPKKEKKKKVKKEKKEQK